MELGIDIGCKEFSSQHRQKIALVFERRKFLYQKYISDIAGQDPEEHRNKPEIAIGKVRDWLATATSSALPGPASIYAEYRRFRRNLPKALSDLNLELSEMTFVDFCRLIEDFLREELT